MCVESQRLHMKEPLKYPKLEGTLTRAYIFQNPREPDHNKPRENQISHILLLTDIYFFIIIIIGRIK